MAYEKEIKEIKQILKGTFASEDDRLLWENKLVDYQNKQYSARENEKILKKAGYLGWKNWG